MIGVYCREESGMNELVYFVNNNGTMKISQDEPDGVVTVHTFHGFRDYSETRDDLKIPPGNMVMLMNYYKFVKENDIQNDFINPNGKNYE